MSAVFLDTVGLLALFDVRDQWHSSAEAAWANIVDRRPDLLTTTFVMAECANAAARRPYRGAVAELHETLETEGAIIVPTDADWREAWNRYAVGDATSPGVVDHLSFIVMRRLGVQRAFTNDRHFIGAGFEALF